MGCPGGKEGREEGRAKKGRERPRGEIRLGGFCFVFFLF
jgi:hypothetical protein